MAGDYLCFLGLVVLCVHLEGCVADRCDVCRRHTNRCQLFSGEFITSTLPTGYNQVGEIAAGACSINITELGPSSNYLALKTLSGKDIINSQWAIASPGHYKRAGTVFKYGRVRDKNCPGECLLALGPTNETIHIQLLTYHTNPGIIYQYQLPGIGRGRSSKGRHSIHGHRQQAHHRQRHPKRHHRRNRVNSVYSSLSDTKPYTANVHSERQTLKQRQHHYHPFRPPLSHAQNHRTIAPNGQKHLLTGFKEPALRPKQKPENAKHLLITSHSTATPITQEFKRPYKAPHRTSHHHKLTSPGSEYITHNQHGQTSGIKESAKQGHKTRFDFHNHPYGHDGLTKSSPNKDTDNRQWEYHRWNTNQRQSNIGHGGKKASSIGAVSPFSLNQRSESNGDDIISRGAAGGSFFPYREDLHQEGSNYHPSPGSELGPFIPYNPPEVTNQPLPGSGLFPQLTVRKGPKYVSPYGEDLPYGNSQPYTDQLKGTRRKTDTHIGYDKQGLRGPDHARGGQNQPYLPEQNSNAIPLHIPDTDYTFDGEVRTVHYSWRISGFTDCSLSCGGGIQETVIICVKGNSEATVTEDNCEARTRPDPQHIQCHTQPCPPDWEEGEWSECSVTCGSGIQRRQVECKQRISPPLQISVSANQCSDTKPSIVQQCQPTLCAQWKTEEWGLCSVKCGRGERRRRVLCVDDNDSPIPDRMCEGPSPKSTEHCHRGSCTTHWFYSDWNNHCSSTCGAGVMTRQVLCMSKDGTSQGVAQCEPHNRPKTQKNCQTDRPCGGQWFIGPWSQCSVECGNGVRTRDVVCMKALVGTMATPVSNDNCLTNERPATEETCDRRECGAEWFMTSWTPCSVSCGTGHQTRELKCLDGKQMTSLLCHPGDKPSTRKICNKHSCSSKPKHKTGSRCKDRISNCRVVAQARLCKYKFYKLVCCSTCSKSHH